MRKQSGFIISSLIFAIALISIIFSVISIGGRSGKNINRDEEYKVVAELVFDQAEKIALAIPSYQKIFSSGDLNDLNFSVAAPEGIFSPDTQLVEVKVFLRKYFRAESAYAEQNNYSPSGANTEFAAGSWRLNKNVEFLGGGVDGFAIVLPDIEQELCEMINQILWGLDTPTPTFPNSLVQWAGGPDPSIDSAPSAVTVPAANNSFREGCAKSMTPERFFYFKMIATP